MAITDLSGAGAAGSGAGGFPYLQAATTAIGAYQATKAAKGAVKDIWSQANQQVAASLAAAADFNAQARASAQQQDLARERQDLAERAETESLRQSRLVENVDVNVGPTLEQQRAARLRRRQFFNQEV